MRTSILLIIATLGSCTRSPVEPAATPEVAAQPVASYDEGVDESRKRLRKSEGVARKGGRSAILYARAANEALGLARLTGDYADYAHAEELLDAAYATENSVPPFLLRARLDYTL